MTYPTCFLNYTCTASNFWDFITISLNTPDKPLFLIVIVAFVGGWVFIKTRSVFTLAVVGFLISTIAIVTSMNIKDSILSISGLMVGIVVIIILLVTYAIIRFRRET